MVFVNATAMAFVWSVKDTNTAMGDHSVVASGGSLFCHQRHQCVPGMPSAGHQHGSEQFLLEGSVPYMVTPSKDAEQEPVPHL